MITYLVNKLPLVRRLRSELAIARHDAFEFVGKLAQADSEIEGSRRDLGECEDELAAVRKKRNELHRQIEEQRETIVNQAATLDGWKLVRNHNEQLIAEQKLALADLRSREERWHNTVQALNGSLNDRNATLADLREELAAAQAELEAHRRPVLFARFGGLSDEELADALAGKGHLAEIKALLQLIDECAVQAMSEAATAPAATITEGPHANRGFTAEDRTFSSGGVYALTQLKQRVEEKLTAKPEGRAAA